MGYPGGKLGAGVYQAIINQIPPHTVYIEAFLGGGAIMTMKRPARLSIGLDREQACIDAFSDPAASPIAAVLTGANRQNGRGWPASPGSALRDRSSADLVVSPRGAMAAIGIIAAPGGGPPASKPASPAGGTSSPGPAIAADIATSGAGRRQSTPSSEAAILPSSISAIHPGTGDSGEASSFRFLVADAIDFLASYPFEGGEVVYCDPPYVRSTRGPRDIYNFEMTDSDHSRLLSVLRTIKARVLLSGYWSKLYVDALPDWRAVTFQTVNRAGRPVTEWLWCNFPEPAALHDYRYLGQNFRERERIKRKKTRWAAKLAKMPQLERYALMASLEAFGT